MARAGAPQTEPPVRSESTEEVNRGETLSGELLLDSLEMLLLLIAVVNYKVLPSDTDSSNAGFFKSRKKGSIGGNHLSNTYQH